MLTIKNNEKPNFDFSSKAIDRLMPTDAQIKRLLGQAKQLNEPDIRLMLDPTPENRPGNPIYPFYIDYSGTMVKVSLDDDPKAMLSICSDKVLAKYIDDSTNVNDQVIAKFRELVKRRLNRVTSRAKKIVLSQPNFPELIANNFKIRGKANPYIFWFLDQDRDFSPVFLKVIDHSFSDRSSGFSQLLLANLLGILNETTVKQLFIHTELSDGSNIRLFAQTCRLFNRLGYPEHKKTRLPAALVKRFLDLSHFYGADPNSQPHRKMREILTGQRIVIESPTDLQAFLNMYSDSKLIKLFSAIDLKLASDPFTKHFLNELQTVINKLQKAHAIDLKQLGNVWIEDLTIGHDYDDQLKPTVFEHDDGERYNWPVGDMDLDRTLSHEQAQVIRRLIANSEQTNSGPTKSMLFYRNVDPNMFGPFYEQIFTFCKQTSDDQQIEYIKHTADYRGPNDVYNNAHILDDPEPLSWAPYDTDGRLLLEHPQHWPKPLAQAYFKQCQRQIDIENKVNDPTLDLELER